MMLYKLISPSMVKATIQLPASKSISNRALIINALGKGTYPPENLSDCDDTQVMIKALTEGKETIDIMAAGTAMRLQAVQTSDGKKWWSAFTGFEEELKGSGSVMSTFLTDIEQLFRMTLTADGIEGVILNPWNRTLMLDKQLIRIILGE